MISTDFRCGLSGKPHGEILTATAVYLLWLAGAVDSLFWGIRVTFFDCQKRVSLFLDRLCERLIDPVRCERMIVILLAGYAAIWTLYGVVSHASQDIHFDMGEMVAWSDQHLLGTPKHPPFGAWLVWAWFAVMPATAWSYHLLAVLVPTVALWFAWRIAGLYLGTEKRVFGIALLTLVPFYNFHALKYNANTVLMPLWALTTWAFLRSLETQRAGWAALTGLGAAAAMLGKYWSIFLLLGLGIAGFSDPRRMRYFRSAAPLITTVMGLLLLAPHLVWLVTQKGESFEYAAAANLPTHGQGAVYVPLFFVGALAYIAVPLVLTAVAARPNGTALRDTLWPPPGPRRTILVAWLAPFLVASAAAILLKIRLVSLWTLPGMALLPVVLLSSPSVLVARRAVKVMLAIAIIFPFGMVALSPLIAFAGFYRGAEHYQDHYRLIAHAVDDAWSLHIRQPLRIVGSESDIANGIVFYFRTRPATFDIVAPWQTPWVSDDQIVQDGFAIVCPLLKLYCLQQMSTYASRTAKFATTDVTLVRHFWGVAGPAVTYRIAIIPPGSKDGSQQPQK